MQTLESIKQVINQPTMPPGNTLSSDTYKQEVENCAIYCLNECAQSGMQRITEGNKRCYVDCAPRNKINFQATKSQEERFFLHLFITFCH